MDKEVLIVIVSSVTTLLVTFGSLFAKAYVARAREQRLAREAAKAEQIKLAERAAKETYSRMLPARHEVYGVLNKVVAEYGATRALVLFTENGGGRPNMSSDLKLSIAYEIYSGGATPVSEVFQRVYVDAIYTSMLDQLIRSPTRSLLLMTRDLPNCQLKQVYIDNKIQMSLVYKVCETEKRFWYASFNFTHDNTPSELLNHAGIAADQLRSVFLDVT